MAHQDGDVFVIPARPPARLRVSSLSLREVAQPIIETLSREANEVVAISVLDGPNVLYITRASHERSEARLTIGSRIPAFCTSMGRVLLGLPEECKARP